MARLEIDPISAKTLPHLDQLYNEGNTDKLSEVLLNTPPEACRRLLLASISRHTKRPGVEKADSNTANLLEELIAMNMREDGDQVKELVDYLGSSKLHILVASIIRYNFYDRGI